MAREPIRGDERPCSTSAATKRQRRRPERPKQRGGVQRTCARTRGPKVSHPATAPTGDVARFQNALPSWLGGELGDKCHWAGSWLAPFRPRSLPAIGRDFNPSKTSARTNKGPEGPLSSEGMLCDPSGPASIHQATPPSRSSCSAGRPQLPPATSTNVSSPGP